MSTASQPHRYNRAEAGTGTKFVVATGATLFAATMLAVIGVFQILAGIVALATDTIYVTGIHYAYSFDVTTWGWIHLVIGIIAVVVGVGLIAGQTWAAVSGIAIASLSAIANFAFIPHYPFWAITIIAFDVFVIWALCVVMGKE